MTRWSMTRFGALAVGLLLAGDCATPEPPEPATLTAPAATASPGATRPGTIVSSAAELADPERRYLFYLHGAIIEAHGRRPTHPRFGVYEYDAILERLAESGLVVVSEARPAGTDPDAYAREVAAQVRTLLDAGVAAGSITVAGFSKGGSIAVRVSHLLGATSAPLRGDGATSLRADEEGLSYVFLACCNQWLGDPRALHGRILSVYEASDEKGRSCIPWVETSADVTAFREVEIRLGGGHGAFYRPDDVWVEEVLSWARGDCPSEAGAAASADGRRPVRELRDGVLVSEALPALRLRVHEVFVYVGNTEVILRDLARAERHHWVRAEDGRVEGLVVVQFEGFLEGVEETYRFGIPKTDLAGSNYRYTPRPVTLGDAEYVHNTWAFDNADGARRNPGAEAAATLELLADRGLRLDDALIMSRYARIVGSERRDELILFYIEPLAASGHSLADFPDGGPPSPAFDALSEAVIRRGFESFELLP